MTQKHQLYKCDICGNIVEVLHEGTGTLACCGQTMTQMAAKPTGGENEKHQPVVEKAEHGTTIKAASVPHPMEEKHYIEWIEACLLYTSDAADDLLCVDLGGRRIIKKKKKKNK